MRYIQLKEKLQKLVIFSPKDIKVLDPDFRLPTLYEWESKGLVKKIRNNNYVFLDFNPHDKDYFFIANKIYEPSYVSLESALSFYSIIPEEVYEVTSITTNKTNNFSTHFGKFTYSAVSPDLFFGYKLINYEPRNLSIASLEKTILDYLYLHPTLNSLDDYIELRWNKSILKESLDIEILEKYLSLTNTKSLQKRSVTFMEYINA